jgi:hypothetical protein
MRWFFSNWIENLEQNSLPFIRQLPPKTTTSFFRPVFTFTVILEILLNFPPLLHGCLFSLQGRDGWSYKRETTVNDFVSKQYAHTNTHIYFQNDQSGYKKCSKELSWNLSICPMFVISCIRWTWLEISVFIYFY